MRALLFLILAAISAGGQVLNVQGGSSTLLNATGGEIVLYEGEAGTVTISGGVFGGHVVAGASDSFKWNGWNANLGDRPLSFALPTDFGPGYAFAGRGASLERGNDDNKLLLFAGATAQQYGAPFANTAKIAEPTALVFWRYELNKYFAFDSKEVFSGKQTAIESLLVHVADLRLAFSGGLGNNSPFFGALVSFANKWVHATASYTDSSPDFRRITLPNVLVTEGRGFNGQVIFQPVHFLNITAARQNYQANNRQAAVSSLGAAVLAGPFDAHGSYFQTQNITGQSAGAGFRFGDRVAVRADEFWAVSGRTFASNITESVSRRIHISEFVTRSAGHTTIALGGDFNSNLVSAGVGYQIMFMPFMPGAPFQRVLDVHLSFQFPHSASATVATTLLPTGKLKYTVYGGEYLYPHWMESQPGQSFSAGGKFLIRGGVVNKSGMPVEGAAIQLGKELVFSDSQGTFFVRTNSGRPVRVRVVPEQFAAPGAWAVVSAPESVMPGLEPAALQIVVARLLE